MIWKQKKRRDRSRAQSSPLREHLQILFYGNTKALSLFSSLCVIWVIPIMHKEDFIYEEKKIVTLALTTALLMTAHAVPASAASNAPESMSQTGSIQTITPRWESTNVVVPSISISGKQISVSVYISPKKSTTSSVGTLYLEKKVGNGWTPVTSWSIDGTGSVSITKTYTGTMGITYRTRVVVTTGVDKIDATSTERTV